MKTPTRMFLAAGFLAAAISQQARPSLILWDGGTSAAWSNGANWIGGTAPANDTTTDLAGFVFSALPAFQPDAGTRQVNGIEIGDGSTAVPEFEISGTDLTLGSGGILKNAASANTTISTDLTLAAGQAWTNNSSGVLLATGGIDNGGFALTVGGSGGTRATGQISGSGNLTMEGSGTLLLEGNNTYTGGTFIGGGRSKRVPATGRKHSARIRPPWSSMAQAWCCSWQAT